MLITKYLKNTYPPSSIVTELMQSAARSHQTHLQGGGGINFAYAQERSPFILYNPSGFRRSFSLLAIGNLYIWLNISFVSLFYSLLIYVL